MTDRDRLIELLNRLFNYHITDPYEIPDVNDFADDLLANGVIVPPCKVGQIVYVPISGTDTILQTKVFAIGVDEDGNNVINPKDYPEGVFGVTGCDFGKTVFLTKEEAEAKLKEREGNG